jgi:SAM-dependent methyltransferase
MTAALQRSTGQPVVALDYSRESLRRLVADCGGLPVLAVHADARRLPLRDGAVAAVCSAGVHPLLPAADRHQMIAELARVLPPTGSLVLSTLNYSWVFRAWRVKGNPGARAGEHLHGRNIPYRRFTAKELRAELAGHFTVHELVGVRNVPLRSITSALRSLARGRGERVARWVERSGPRLDRALEGLPLSRLAGFLLVARASRPSEPHSSPLPSHPARPRARHVPAAVPRGGPSV